MNRRHRSAQLAGRASVQLHTLIVFSGENGNKEEDAYVLDVDTNASSEPSFTVIVPRYGIEGRVRIPNLTANDKNIVRDAEKHLISYKGNKIQVFDKVRVKIYVNVVQETQKELMIDLVSPVFGEQMDKTSCVEIEATPEKKRKISTQSSAESASAKKHKKKKSKK